MHIRMMRKSSAHVDAMKTRAFLFKSTSLVEDRGQCLVAIRSSQTNCYHFEDTAVGARPLVLIGTSTEIGDFLRTESRYGIVNNIRDLPHIYVRTARYRPRERFRQLYAAGEAARYAADTVKALGGVVADPMVSHAFSAIPSLGPKVAWNSAFKSSADLAMVTYDDAQSRGAFDSIAGLFKKKENADSRYYVEFTPLVGSDAVLVGTHRVNFNDSKLAAALAKSLRG